MASETMTVAEARIWVVRNPSGEVQGVSTQDEYRAARDAGWGSHGFAAWDADGSMYSGWTITQEAHARATTAGTGADLSYGYDDDGEDCSDAWYELTTMAASTRPDSDYITREWKLTFGQVRRYVEELRTRKAQKATGAGGGRVTDAMVEAARAAFSREWYEDVEARPMRVALTAALAASARGA